MFFYKKTKIIIRISIYDTSNIFLKKIKKYSNPMLLGLAWPLDLRAYKK
jgi:hypothetical protein